MLLSPRLSTNNDSSCTQRCRVGGGAKVVRGAAAPGDAQFSLPLTPNISQQDVNLPDSLKGKNLLIYEKDVN